VVLVHIASLSLRLMALGLSLILWRRIRDFRVGVLSGLAAVLVVIEARTIQGGGVAEMVARAPERIGWTMMLVSILLLAVMILLWGVFGREQARTATLEATLASLHDGVVRTNADGLVQDMNKAAEDLTGWHLIEARDQPIQRVVHVTTIGEEEGHRIALDTLEDGGQMKRRALLESRIGAQIEVELTYTSLEGTTQNRTDRIMVLHDRTHLRKAQDELLRAGKLESLGVLAGGIAHDFNNLLTGVSGNVSLAMEILPVDGNAFMLLQRIEHAAVRAKALSRQLLTFAAGGQPLQKNTSIGKLITETVTFALAGRAVDCALDLEPELYATVDRGQLAQVLQNLVINGCEAMDNGGTLKVQARYVMDCADVPGLPTGDFVMVEVSDSGSGISQDALRRVFEPYFTTKSTGTGLGLAVAHSIIRQHDGQIQITSEPDVGTTVRFWLPTSGPPVLTEHSEHFLAPQKGVRILVMDDDPVVSEVAEMMLNRLGFSVTVTYEGREAVEAYQAAQQAGRAFHLVLLDMTVPGGMGGLETVKALLEIDPAVRAIGTSGYSVKVGLGSLQEHGFIAALPKPFTLAEMKAVLAEAMAAE
jgi:PAS domain S-box-containing protein